MNGAAGGYDDGMMKGGEPDDDGPVQFVTCPECGNEQGDMGHGVACEECGFGPMPAIEPEEAGE